MPSEPSSRLITVACLTAAGVVVLGPHAAVAVSAAPTFASPRCADTEVPVVMLAGDSSPGLTLLGDATTHSHVGHVEVGTAELARDLTVSAPELAAAFRDAQPGMTVLESYNLMAARDDSIGGTTFLVVPTAAVPHDKTLISTCARPLRNSENPAYAVMYATTLGR